MTVKRMNGMSQLLPVQMECFFYFDSKLINFLRLLVKLELIIMDMTLSLNLFLVLVLVTSYGILLFVSNIVGMIDQFTISEA
jgi:hypothetical protein